MTIALTSATGKLGGGILNAILDNKLLDPRELVVCTSSDLEDSRFDALRSQNINLRQANFNNFSSLKKAYSGCERLLLVSSPFIEMDYNDAPLWQGREKHHRAAIDAALEAGVKHIYYTSLAFSGASKAGVMRAHVRTETYLRDLEKEGKIKITIIREGLYSEAWPLAFGYYFGLKDETRKEVLVAGEGAMSFTSLSDITFGTAKVLAGPKEHWAGKTVHICQRKALTLQDIAKIVSRVQGREVQPKVVSRTEFEDHYAANGVERAAVEWWSTAYEAIANGECDIDDPTLEEFLREAGRSPAQLETTIENMLK
ncbi:NmrA family protein [Stagonosporopsis vannaccii]|nr:NmrA family protein [Stagonosporopsis vannaccii]